MEALSPAAFSASFNFSQTLPIRPHQSFTPSSSLTLKFPNSTTNKNHLNLSSSSSSFISCVSTLSTKTRATSPSAPHPSLSSPSASTHHWMVLMEGPPLVLHSKPEVTSYYVRTLERVLGSERDAQKRIYDVSLNSPFGFCCDIDEEASRKLSGLPGVLSVMPDPDVNSTKKDYSSSRTQPTSLPNLQTGSTLLFPAGNTKGWLVRMDKPGVGVVTKAQMVDFYSQILTKVLQNEQDAQMCIYNVSWQSNFGFCCELDEECAKELAGVPGVLSVEPDENFESDNKDYGGGKNSKDQPDSSEASQKTPVKSKKLFVTGLSFYTSEKTLRAAFEGFGELVGVKIIMDKISKRSKGYAFVEYTTEEAASAALKEMNGKIINGWMIVVDVAKSTPQKHDRSRSGPIA